MIRTTVREMSAYIAREYYYYWYTMYGKERERTKAKGIKVCYNTKIGMNTKSARKCKKKIQEKREKRRSIQEPGFETQTAQPTCHTHRPLSLRHRRRKGPGRSMDVKQDEKWVQARGAWIRV